MPKEEWGTKRLCPHCATRFYDLTNDPMTCPACGNVFSLESLTSGRSRSLIAEKTAARGEDRTDLVDDEDLDDDADTGDLDDDLLDDDDDDGDVSLDDIADVPDSDEE
ncbi:FYDLN acid domain-containing protein [Paracoccus sp. CPCC 101403]|uniref:FYDLN acid domain-containing protein n=2 Tax=Paracoccus broussonetiae TaxID=3075834 RepID=A0ABU3ECA2_9RHOB|nr:FYDLN acid domain-containing protein [Paracoccus sp. CPCC 101403]MDT1061115.1 FYDLN acid domain-containing protein [Paracoccus sp. CPCC 101403]